MVKKLPVKFLGQEISPMTLENKNFVVFKYKLDKHYNLKTVEKIIKKVLQGYPNYQNLQFRINVKIDNARSPQKWFMGPPSTYDEIDFKEDFFYLRDSWTDYYTDSEIQYFQIYIKSTKTKKIVSKKAGKEEHNDCLFNCILQAFGYNTDLLKIKQPHKLKKLLGYERDDKIELTNDNLEKIEELFNISFSICGDMEYQSKEMKQFNINLKLQNEHASLLCNEGRDGRMYERKEENIYTFCYDNDDIIYYDGEKRTVIPLTEYESIKKPDILLIQCENADELTAKRKEYLKKAKRIKKHTKGMINFYKSCYHSNIAYDIFKTITKAITEPKPLDLPEHQVLDRAYRGGLHYSQKGIFNNCYDYDLNAMYSHYMNSNDFNFPTSKPEYKTITQEEFNKFTFYPYGIYNVIITGSHKFNYLQTNKPLWICHYDIYNCKKMNLTINLVDNNNNALIYKQRMKGKQAFSTFTELMEKYINIEELEDYKQDIKEVRNSLWGYFSRKNTQRKVIKKDDTFAIDDYFLEECEDRDTCISVKITDKNEIFKNPWCRCSVFLTAYCRYKMMEIIIKHDTDNNIVCVNTDGFISTKELDLDIGSAFGQWKIKHNKQTAKIHNSNIIDWS